MRRAREAPQRARHDEPHGRAPPERVELGRRRAREQPLVLGGERAAAAVRVDGRADPSVALDGHVEVEARAGRTRAPRGACRASRARRSARRTAGSPPPPRPRTRGTPPLAARRELGRPPRDDVVLVGRRAVVVVEPDQVDGVVMRAGLSGVAASPSGKLCIVGSPSSPVPRAASPCAPSRATSSCSWNSIQSTCRGEVVGVARVEARRRDRRSRGADRASRQASRSSATRAVLRARNARKARSRRGGSPDRRGRRGSRAPPRCRPGRGRWARRASAGRARRWPTALNQRAVSSRKTSLA